MYNELEQCIIAHVKALLHDPSNLFFCFFGWDKEIGSMLSTHIRSAGEMAKQGFRNTSEWVFSKGRTYNNYYEPKKYHKQPAAFLMNKGKVYHMKLLMMQSSTM